MVGGHRGGPSRATPREVAFLWPGGVKALEIAARPVYGVVHGSNTQPRSYLGYALLRSPTDPCQIRLKPLEYWR
jgi:hypothetical protein